MNKRKLQHNQRQASKLKPWYFLVLALLSGVICVFALRANNQHMTELRDAVYSADKNNGDVQSTLKDLQAYVTTHMNTDLTSGKTPIYPPIQLKYTYDRLKAAQDAKFAKSSNIYSDAQAYCEGQNSHDFSGRNRVPCIEAYVKAHSIAKAPEIPDSLYKFSFASPRWSSDLAGWSLLAVLLFGGLFVLGVIYKKLINN